MQVHKYQELNRTQEREKSTASVRRETEFATLLKTLSEKKGPTKNERIQNAVSEAAQKYNLDPNLINAVIKQESGFKPCAESHCGAQGLMQLMPGTAKDLGVTDSLNIEQNVDGGCKYLRQMLDKFGGNVKLALAAYNAGPENVKHCMCIPHINKDGSLNTETPEYVRFILGLHEEMKKHRA